MKSYISYILIVLVIWLAPNANAQIAITNTNDTGMGSLRDAVTLSPPTPFTIPFVTTWKSDNSGPSPDNEIVIPAIGSGYSYDIYWEEVSNPAHNGTATGLKSGTNVFFGTPGTYRIEITGEFPRIYFNNSGDKDKLLTIEQWGDGEWASMANAFHGCSNLTYGTSTGDPNLSSVSDMSFMFAGASSFNGDIGSWNMLAVTNVSNMFNGATSFNQDIGAWTNSTRNITNMSSMFEGATSFNTNISNWNVEAVVDMSRMFFGATSFDTFLDTWDVSNVTNMSSMFEGASNFNEDIRNWSVDNVTDMSNMFKDATSFNVAIGDWDVGSVQNMSGLFDGATSFARDVDSWSVGSVTNMSAMFRNATSMNRNIEDWDVSNVTDMSSMFEGATSFNQDISTGTGWNVSNVTNMSSMFNGATLFNQDIGNWNVALVTDFSLMFNNATSFDQNLGTWSITSVSDMSSMLNNTALSVANYDATLIGWEAQGPPSAISLGAVGLQFCAAASAHSNLNWDITDAGSACSDPDIEVYQGISNAGIPLTHGQVIPARLGHVDQGTDNDVTFAIENIGTADLNVASVGLTNGNGGDFSVVSVPTTVSAGSTENFVIRLSGATKGIYNNFIEIISDDPDESAIRFPVTGTVGELDAKVYWTDITGGPEDEINRSNLDGSNAQLPYYDGFTVNIAGVAVDTTNNMVFWTNNDAEIHCGRIGEGGFVATGKVLDESGGSVREFRGIDFNHNNSKIYWCDAENDQIRSINIDGTDPQVLVAIEEPHDIALDVAGGKMYYTVFNIGTPELWRADLDGTSQERLYFSGSTLFKGVDLDLDHGHVYWVESVGGISRVDLDGNNQINISISASISDPEGLAINAQEGKIYFVENTPNAISRVNLDGSDYEVIQTAANVANAVHVDIDPRFPSLPLEVPTVYLPTEVTTKSLIANFTAPVGAIDVFIDIDDDPAFGSQLVSDASVGVSGTSSISVSFVIGTQYYYRARAEYSSGFSAYTSPVSFMVSPGNALSFDGVDDFVDLGNSLDSEISGIDKTFSLGAWIFPTSIDANGEIIIAKSAASPCGADERQFSMNLRSDGTLRFTYYGTLALVQQRTVGGTTALGLNQWHHVAATYDGSIDSSDGLGRVKLFINGVEETTSLLVSLGSFPYDIPPGPAPLVLGAHVNSSGTICVNVDQAFSGAMDAVRIWDGLRTQTEIAGNLYNTLTGNETGLLAYYNFDEGITAGNNTTPPVNLLPDRTGNGNNGSLNSFALNGPASNWIMSASTNRGGVILQDYNALVALYNATDGANWMDNTNWLSVNPVNIWNGVTVSGDRVGRLDLDKNNLVGSLPVEIGCFDAMTGFILENNMLSGSIPNQVGEMASLEVLDLDENLLSGLIPIQIGNLSSLRMLDLDKNQLNGIIPTEIGNLGSLGELYLNDNQLTGSIPSQLGNLSNLTRLYLDNNSLTGNIPSAIGNLALLTELGLDNNQLDGNIPVSLGSLTELLNLELHKNLLTGTIPTTIGNLTKLQNLSLYVNQLAGTIPVEIGNLVELLDLDLSHNRISGSIPPEIGNLTKLTDLELDDNQLTGSIPTELGLLTTLEDVQLDINQLTGVVPISFSNLIVLDNLELNDNMLEDMADLSTLSTLAILNVANNNFHFDDIELNLSVPTHSYSPQANVPSLGDVSITEGELLDVAISVGGSANQYQWYKDGVAVSGQTTDNLSIATVAIADGGVYYLQATSTLVSGLTLRSEDVSVQVEPIINVFIGDDTSGTIVLNNDNIDLGTTPLNEDIERTFVIENLSTSQTLTINSITTDNAVFEVLDFDNSVAPAQFMRFTIALRALEVGVYSTNVDVSTNVNNFIFTVTGEVTSGGEDLNIYNVVTPNSDEVHDFFKIGNITSFPSNEVIIYNRWGDRVFEMTGYDNDQRIFTGVSNVGSGGELDEGNYYYAIDKGDGGKKETGFLFLKR